MSLLLGLIAALAWGIHDILVRFISQKISTFTAILTVLSIGALLALPFAFIFGNWQAMSPSAYGLSAASGVCFAIGTLSLYFAFAIGPVKLVAPIIGAYPILSVALATLTGTHTPIDQWLAVITIVAGVGFIALNDPDKNSDGKKLHAIAWASLAAVGFFATFAIGQAASRAGSELPSLIAIRAAAILTIVIIAALAYQSLRPNRAYLPLLAAMGSLDAIALGAIMVASSLPNPEFAPVASSIFGMLTVIFARIFLKEPMTSQQWICVAIVFTTIGYLAAQ